MIFLITGWKSISVKQVGRDFFVIEWADYLNENDDIASLTLMAAEQELSKKPLISLSSIEIEEDKMPTFKELMEEK